MSFHRPWWTGILLCVVALPASFAWIGQGKLSAGEPLTREELEAFLELGWTRGPESLAGSEKRYRDFQEQAKGGTAVDCAFALIQLRQLKFTDAEKLLSRVVEQDPKNQQARRLQIWLAISRRDFDTALERMLQLVKGFPAANAVTNQPNEAEDREYQTDLLKFLGRGIGFMEGPGAVSIKEVIVADYCEKMVVHLGPERSEIFEKARRDALARYVESKDQQDRTRESAKAEEEQDKEERLRDLGEQRESIGRQSEALKQASEKLQAAVKAKLDEIARKDQPLATRYAQLDAQGTAIGGQIRGLNTEIAGLEDQRSREKNPNTRAQIETLINVRVGQLARLENDFAAVARQAAGVAAQRQQLQQQAAGIQADAANELERKSNAFESLQKKLRANESQEQRLKKSNPKGETTEVKAKGSVLSAFSTYEPLALEREKQRLLETMAHAP